MLLLNLTLKKKYYSSFRANLNHQTLPIGFPDRHKSYVIPLSFKFSHNNVCISDHLPTAF